MTLFEVALKVSLDAFWVNLSRRFPSASVYIWCNKENDVFEVIVRNPESYPLVRDEVRAHNILEVVEESSDDHRFCLIIRKCSCMKENTIVRHIGELNLLNIFPNIIENGWVYHRLVVFKHDDLQELLRRFDNWGWTYKILRKVRFDGFIASSLTLSADVLFSDLTQKQMDALLTAHRLGYYELPRRTDVQTIAAKRRVPRTTFQEHLKKAENKLVTSLVPYVQLFKHAPKDQKETLAIN